MKLCKYSASAVGCVAIRHVGCGNVARRLSGKSQSYVAVTSRRDNAACRRRRSLNGRRNQLSDTAEETTTGRRLASRWPPTPRLSQQPASHNLPSRTFTLSRRWDEALVRSVVPELRLSGA